MRLPQGKRAFWLVKLQGFADIHMGIGAVIIGLGSVIIAETLIRLATDNISVWLSLALVLRALWIFQLVLCVYIGDIGVDANLLGLVTVRVCFGNSDTCRDWIFLVNNYKTL